MKRNFHASILFIMILTANLNHGSDKEIELSYIKSLKKHESLLKIVSLHRFSTTPTNIRSAYHQDNSNKNSTRSTFHSFSSGDNNSLAKSRPRKLTSTHKETNKKSPSSVNVIDSDILFPFDFQDTNGVVIIPAGTSLNDFSKS